MASALLKRVVIENYKIFSTKQEVCFSVDGVSSNNSKYFTLVGENGCGKSTFLALVGLASDFGGRVTTRICDSARESIVACEYEVENWHNLSYIEHDTIVSIYPALQLWFLEGILKIPKEVQQYLLEQHPELGVLNLLTLVIGFKHTPNSDGGCHGNIDKFLYIKCGEKIIVLVQPLNGSARMTVVDGLEGYDLLYWSQTWSRMVPTQCNFLRCSTDIPQPTHNYQTGSRCKHPQCAVILALRNTLLPVESRDIIWNEVRIFTF